MSVGYSNILMKIFGQCFIENKCVFERHSRYDIQNNEKFQTKIKVLNKHLIIAKEYIYRISDMPVQYK